MLISRRSLEDRLVCLFEDLFDLVLIAFSDEKISQLFH